MSEGWIRGCDTGSCVEVRCESGNCVQASAPVVDGPVFLRSSLAPDDMLSVTRDEWDAFVLAVKAGEFDAV